MGREILFKQEDFVFSYRVGGILKANKRILMQKPATENYYSIIGGSVSCMETTEKALIRMFWSEIQAQIKVERLFAVGEIFFPVEDKPCHQICLYYEVKLLSEGGLPMEGTFHGEDASGYRRKDVEFCWIPMDEFNKGINVYPKEILPYLRKMPKETVHILSRQI